MSAIIELQERIQNTVVRIGELEKAARLPGAPRSLGFTIRSLEKFLAELQQDFARLAKDEELEVLKYRLVPQQNQRSSITAIANAWTKYQAMFSSVYDSLLKQSMEGGKRKRTRKQLKAETEFAFAYTFHGSIGVALTLPMQQLSGARARAFEEVVNKVTDMARARTPEEIANFVETLGVPPVVRFGNWVDAHVAFGAGAGFEWEISESMSTPDLSIQIQEFKVLKEAIHKVTEPREETAAVTGLLTMADMDKRKFRMRLDSGEDFTGTFVDAIGEEQRAELPRRYEALVRITTEIQPAIEKKKISRFLVRLIRQLPI